MFKLFYSYSHRDEEFRDAMEKHLAMLKHDRLIDEWHDRKILPGQDIHNEIASHLNDADIVLLLLSSDFLASPECRLEVDRSLALKNSQHTVVVPIILRSCAWQDHPEISALLALPKDGLPVAQWNDSDRAFLDIYQGIKAVLRSIPPSLRTPYRTELTEVEFVSQNHATVQLDDLFVFPHIIHEKDRVEMAKGTRNTRHAIKDFAEISKIGNHLLLAGDDKSGKTVFCRKLFLHHLDNDVPVLLLPGANITSRVNHEATIARAFHDQFTGDYKQWQERPDKTLIIDDLTNNTPLPFIEYAQKTFKNLFVAVSDDEYISFFRDDARFAGFEILRLRSLTHVQQERLVERWVALGTPTADDTSVGHGIVDQIEDRLNSIILHDKIVPRYPFYVLSILQTYEAFMPRDLQITTHGHCYQALITANLLWNGVHSADIDSCFNFLGCLAFDIFERGSGATGETGFEDFVQEYKDQYVIKPSVLARLTKKPKPIIKLNAGRCFFRYPFIYYFFLGYELARNYNQHKDLVVNLVEESYVRDNAFVLIFMVHHTQDESLIDLLSSRTIAELDAVHPATLHADEMRSLEEALKQLPEHILGDHSVESARVAEREHRDWADTEHGAGTQFPESPNRVSPSFRSLKNMEILGQILKNRYGSLSRSRLEEVVKVISDTGFCLIADAVGAEAMQRLEDFSTEMARDRDLDSDEQKAIDFLGRHLHAIVALFILGLLGKTVECIQKPELRQVVRHACERGATPAHDLLYVLYLLETATELHDGDVIHMERLNNRFRKAHNRVVQRLLSLAVQMYLLTHEVPYALRQRTCDRLGIPYTANPAKR